MTTMPALRELQAAFLTSMVGPDTALAAACIAGDGLDPVARLDIYRHHIFTTLTEALKGTFPVVCRLVDERFFAYAADTYLRQHPPSGPCLVEYGATFPGFRAEFPPCRGLPYLTDVARLEWALNRAVHAEDRPPLDPSRLAATSSEVMPRLIFRLDPSLSLVASSWPIDRIWHAHQGDREDLEVVDLDGGGIHREIRRGGGTATMRAVSRTRYVFRRALQEGLPLERAAAAAMELDPSFDLTQEIRQFLEDRLPVEFLVSSGEE